MRILLISKSTKSRIRANKMSMRGFRGNPFTFMEFQILIKTKLANKQSFVKNEKGSSHEFCKPGNFLANKIHGSSVKQK